MSQHSIKTFYWYPAHWASRDLYIADEEEVVAQMTFPSFWNFDTVYTDRYMEMEIRQAGFFRNRIEIIRNDTVLGEMNGGFWGNRVITLINGHSYWLDRSLWSSEVHWKSESGEIQMTFHQPVFSSPRKGTIYAKDDLPYEIERVLLSVGVFHRILSRRRKNQGIGG